MLRWEKGGPAAYSIKGGAGDFNEEGGKPQDNAGNKYFPASIISFCIFSPHPLPLLSFWFLVRFLASFVVTSVRPPPLPLAPPRFLTGSDCLKTPDSAEKGESCFLAWVAEGGREEDAGGAGGEEPAGTTQLNINPISWRQREEGEEAWPAL